MTLEEELIRIPLFIRLPAGAGIPPGVYPHLFQNDDVFALCLSLAGPGDPLGATLIEDVAARRAVRQLAFAKLYHEPSAETMREPRWRSAQQWAVRSTEVKVVRDLEGRVEAYDVTDPAGERPVELPPPASPIMQALDRFRAGTDGSTRRTLAPLSPAERDRLRALGYIR